jgi:hypothetical protein
VFECSEFGSGSVTVPWRNCTKVAYAYCIAYADLLSLLAKFGVCDGSNIARRRD